jgi:chromosome condensin MukBEF ATPase and DNA-binding subunit MukB
LECQLRQNDQEVVVEKIKWLKKTSKELERQIAQQREDISLLQASAKRQIEEVQAKIDQLVADKLRLEKLKE